MCKYNSYVTPTDHYLDVYMKWSTYAKATAMIICILITSTDLLISSSSRNTQKSMSDKWEEASVGQGGLFLHF